MGLLDIETTLEQEKVMTRVKGSFQHKGNQGDIYGYEIHMGTTEKGDYCQDFIALEEVNGVKVESFDGTFNEGGNLIGTYIHGIFDGVDFRQYLLNNVRKSKGMAVKVSNPYEGVRDKEINKLADIVRESLDMEKIYEILGMK